jgi:hypothetical protein
MHILKLQRTAFSTTVLQRRHNFNDLLRKYFKNTCMDIGKKRLSKEWKNIKFFITVKGIYL